HREPRRVEGAELGARIEPDVALVVRQTGDKLPLTAADVRGPARLQAEAEPVLLGIRAVDRRPFDAVVRRDQLAVRVSKELLLAVLLLAHEARRVLALLEVRIVAVVRRDVARAIVRIPGQRNPARDAVLALDVEEQQLVPRLVGTRENGVAVDREELRRRGAI